MEIFKAKLTERIQRVSSIESFRFVTENKINFIAGQFLQIIFDEANKSNKDLNKYLSFSSSPTKDYIEITKRLGQSQFSQKLITLKPGDGVLIEAPFGNCVFKEEYKKIGFLIGGIGITPVISIIEYIIDKKLDTDIILFYSNKTPDEIAFKQELDHWRSKDSNLRIVYTLTDCQTEYPGCVSGRINNNLLSEKAKDWKERKVFIFGPPKMVEAMNNLCLEVNCTKENIKSENFIGY